MTAVKGPFVFTSDRWSDDFITKAKQGECRALALQLGVAPPTAWDKVRAAGLQTIAWGDCLAGPAAIGAQLVQSGSSLWMPQAENTPEFDALITCLTAGIQGGRAIEPVMTAGGIDITGSDAEKVVNRTRRHDLLASFNVREVWVEVYKQDADRSGKANLGDVNHEIAFFESDLLFGAGKAHPVIGLWTVDDSQPWAKNPYGVSSYDLARHGRAFGAWRAEQMADARYTEIATVPPLVHPQPPPKYTTAQARVDILALVERWEHDNPAQVLRQPRLVNIGRIAGSEIPDSNWRDRKVGQKIAAILDQEAQ